MAKKKRVIVIGDPHGCVDEVRRVLDTANYDSSEDTVISLGDNVDRGPDPLGVCRLLMELGAETLLGNHEAAVLRRADWEGRELRPGETPMKANPERDRSFAALREDPAVMRWLKDAELAHEVPESRVVLVHAGIRPERDTRRLLDYIAPWDCMRTDDPLTKRGVKDAFNMIAEATTIRWVRPAKDRAPVQIGAESRTDSDRFWAELWNPRAPHVVFGHQPFHEVKFFRNATGIDTGCCEGGALTAVVIPLGEENRRGWTFHSVKAARQYFVHPEGSDGFLEL